MRLLAALAATLLLATSAQAQVQIDAPWARPTVAGQTAGGGFLRLKSPQADRLVGASSPVAARVELHRMSMEGDVMRMRHVDLIELPAGQTVALAPGGLHLMFIGLKAPLKLGDKLALTLKFERGGEVKLEMPVLAQPAAAAGGHKQ